MDKEEGRKLMRELGKPEYLGELWDAVNEYARTCGGDPGRYVYGNIPRMDAVVQVDRVVEQAVAAERGRCVEVVSGMIRFLENLQSIMPTTQGDLDTLREVRRRLLRLDGSTPHR